MKYVIGLDYGSDSCRAVLTNTADGSELASSVFEYPRWKKGMYCDPVKEQYRQHPLDYIEGLEYTITQVLKQQPKEIVENVVAIGVDCTGSTPCAVDKEGTPLALKAGFEENPNAMFVLWKDHTSIKEASEINNLAKTWGGVDYTKYSGGTYSAEWFFSKALHILRVDTSIKENAYSFLEHTDFVPAMLTGVKDVHNVKRSRCTAGHKAMWHKDWNGLPSQEFLSKLDPLFDGLRDRLFEDTYTAETSAGTLTKEWADKLGLSQNVVVNVASIDAHVGSVGANIKPKSMVKVMGTSTGDIFVEEMSVVGDKLISGICGQVDGSVIGGLLGMEAGQSAFGDIYAWFKRLIEYPLQFVEESQKAEISKKLLVELEKEATNLPVSEVLSLDWFNGRRTPHADQTLKGAIMGLNLGVTAPMMYRALIEATSFGAKAIIDCITEQGVEINEVIAIGGVSKKSALNMQITSDVLNMPIKISSEEQTVALGASIFAAVCGGVYKTVSEAQEKMASKIEKTYVPNPEMVAIYKEKYAKYKALGEKIESLTK